jgi:pimeloyl-ACP methyl ester carboxylesterase
MTRAILEASSGKDVGMQKVFYLVPLVLTTWFMSCSSLSVPEDETLPYRVSLWNEVPQLSRDSGPPGPGSSSPLAEYGQSLVENIRKTCNSCAGAQKAGADYTENRPENLLNESQTEHLAKLPAEQQTEQPASLLEEQLSDHLVYRMGWVPFREEARRSADLQLFVQVLYRTTERPRGTALLFHGYANDSSYMTGVAGALLDRNWAVILVDLPGHGLSTGPRGDVKSFFDYGDTVHRILEQVLPMFAAELPEPLIAFGHSTGALALIDYAIRYPNRFSRLVLYAPLIRPVWWNTARFSRWILSPFIKQTRAFTKSPLGLRVFPVHWFDELVRWNAWAQKQEHINLPPTRIIQPVHDTVVQSSYNARFIQSRAEETELIRIDGLSHFATDSRTPDHRLLEAIISYFK